MALGREPVLHASESFFSTVKTQKEIARNNVWASAACKKALPVISLGEFDFGGEKKLKKKNKTICLKGGKKKSTVRHFESLVAASLRGVLTLGRWRGWLWGLGGAAGTRSPPRGGVGGR